MLSVRLRKRSGAARFGLRPFVGQHPLTWGENVAAALAAATNLLLVKSFVWVSLRFNDTSCFSLARGREVQGVSPL